MGFLKLAPTSTGIGTGSGDRSALGVSKTDTRKPGTTGDAWNDGMRKIAGAALTTPALGSYRSIASEGSGTGFGSGGMNNGNSGFNTNRYAPNTETLDRTSLLDDITPKSDAVLMNLFEIIYERDAVAGPATDLISTLPWSDWTLSGIDDPAIMRIYEDAMENFDPVNLMPELTREYLAYGKFVSSLLYDADQSTWIGMIPHNPKYVVLTPTPIRGQDPLIDVTPSPEMEAFLQSKDKRFQLSMKMMPEKMLKELKKGKAELEPLTTLFVPRKVTTTDWKGTSMFMRILPYYAIEKALMQSTISSARRRTRSILHLTVGVEGQWEPEPSELDAVSTMFQASEEDPVGAIIATRSGIEANEVRSGGDFWKISEEADYLKQAKLNAFGMSETFLTGEASYNTMEASLSVFIENLKCLRASLEMQVFEKKIFDVLARAHDFVKHKSADASHHVRTGTRTRTSLANLEDAMKIPRRDLLIPKIHWAKNLSPTSDASYIELLKSLKEQKIPITMKMWASAGGVDLVDLEQQLEEDKQIRERFQKYADSIKALSGPAGGGDDGGNEEGDGGFGAFSYFVDPDAITVLGSFTDHDDHRHGNFFGVSYKTLRAIALDLLSSNVRMKILRDNKALSSYLNSRFDGNQTKIDATKYMLTRMNLARARVSDQFVSAMATKLTVTCSSTKDKKKLKALKNEAEILATIHQFSKAKTKKPVFDRNAVAEALKLSLKQQQRYTVHSSANALNYSGV